MLTWSSAESHSTVEWVCATKATMKYFTFSCYLLLTPFLYVFCCLPLLLLPLLPFFVMAFIRFVQSKQSKNNSCHTTVQTDYKTRNNNWMKINWKKKIEIIYKVILKRLMSPTLCKQIQNVIRSWYFPVVIFAFYLLMFLDALYVFILGKK